MREKAQRQLQDEPTLGENDLLVLAIKFEPKYDISLGRVSLETCVWRASRSRYLPGAWFAG